MSENSNPIGIEDAVGRGVNKVEEAGIDPVGVEGPSGSREMPETNDTELKRRYGGEEVEK